MNVGIRNGMKKTGFTLVEILIVVVILGILAAIVVPQFSLATVVSKESTLKHDLQMLRSQLNLYRVQHGDKYPWEIVGEDSDLVIEQMTSRTNELGDIGAAPRDYRYGPYLERMPVNHFVKDTGGAADTLDFVPVPPTAGVGTTGWLVDTSMGKMYANTNTADFPDHIRF